MQLAPWPYSALLDGSIQARAQVELASKQQRYKANGGIVSMSGAATCLKVKVKEVSSFNLGGGV